ncbi:MAG: hypothetical protein ACI8S6_004529 [Myxococcota bacterium]|jgi:hypothetical protein
MRVLLLAVFFFSASPALADTGDTGEVVAPEPEDTGSGSSSPSWSLGGLTFSPPDDADGYKTSGSPRLAEDSKSCGGSAAGLLAPLLLLGLWRRR